MMENSPIPSTTPEKTMTHKVHINDDDVVAVHKALKDSINIADIFHEEE